MALAPVTAVGFLVLLGAMAVCGALATRFRVAVRWVLAGGGLGGGGRGWPPGCCAPGCRRPCRRRCSGVLSLWTLLVVTLLWQRMRWLRPLGVALLGVLACCWLPGPDADAVVVLAAVGGLLTALLAEEYPGLLVRRGGRGRPHRPGPGRGAARAGRHPPPGRTAGAAPQRWPRPAGGPPVAEPVGPVARCVRWRSPSRPWASPGRWRT